MLFIWASAKGQLRWCGEIHPAAIENEGPAFNDLAITFHDSYLQAFSGEKP